LDVLDGRRLRKGSFLMTGEAVEFDLQTAFGEGKCGHQMWVSNCLLNGGGAGLKPVDGGRREELMHWTYYCSQTL